MTSYMYQVLKMCILKYKKH